MLSSFSRMVKVCEICCVLALVVSLPSQYRSTRFLGMRSLNGGWLRMVGFVFARLASRILMFTACGSFVIRAPWSP